MNIDITMPITEEDVAKLHVGDTVTITGNILCGRDAVLPKVIKLIDEGKAEDLGLKGNLIFHTAVSPAGVGPTSSNKLEIEMRHSRMADNDAKKANGQTLAENPLLLLQGC